MKTVFFDVDTQIDFLYPAGALYVPGAERLMPALTQLNRHAAASGITVVSSMDAHTENDPEFRTWPAHCVAGTPGQAKPAATLLEKRVVVPNTPSGVAIDGAQQILVEKQTLDVFETCTILPVLQKLRADRYLVYGVVTEYCVIRAATGLLRTGKPVGLVTDAIQFLDDEQAGKALREFEAAGGALTTLRQACAAGIR